MKKLKWIIPPVILALIIIFIGYVKLYLLANEKQVVKFTPGTNEKN